MADTDTRAATAEQPRDESRSEARRDLNKTVAQRQKLLLAGIGGVSRSLEEPSSGRDDIARDVERVQQQGERRVGSVKAYIDRKTRDAKGASAEAADDVKDW